MAAVLFEGSLALGALVAGLLLGHYPSALVRQIGKTWADWLTGTAWGVAATAPLLAGLLLIEVLTLPPLRRLDQLVQQRFVPLFRGTSLGELALVAVLAGVGEELCFRSLLQDGLEQWIGAPTGRWIALAVVSVLFGLCHWVSGTYAVLATLVGVYLGIVFLATESLLAPVIAHALYDFVALVYLVRWKQP